MKAECETCEIRKYYARAFDFHFTECDCPFKCEEEERCVDKDKDVLCKSAEKSEEECEDENWYTELDDPKIAERSEE